MTAPIVLLLIWILVCLLANRPRYAPELQNKICPVCKRSHYVR